MSQVLADLWTTIQARKEQLPARSYTAELLAGGVPGIARKVGEEAVETAVAALSESDERVLSEMADLFYHSLVLLAARDLTLGALEAELKARFRSPG